MFRKIILSCGILAPVLYMITIMAGATLLKDYSHLVNAIGMLIANDALNRVILELNFKIYGGLLLAIAVCVYLVVKNGSQARRTAMEVLMKRILSIILGVVVLTVTYAVLFMIGSNLTTPSELAERMSPEAGLQAASRIPVVALLMTGTMAYLALRSRWHGLKLATALFVVFFGIYTFLAQIEALAFPAVAEQMPPGTIPGFFLAGLILTLPFSLLAVWVLGRRGKDPLADQSNSRLQMPVSEWAWKLVLAVILYETIYFTFGYYVAWRTPGLPEFYGGTDPGTFFGQLANVARDTPWLFLFQVFRALVWTAIGCIIIRMHKGGTLETACTTGLAFSLLMSATMLLPNPLMPPVIYRAHAIELVSSNFVFGILLTLLLIWPVRKQGAVHISSSPGLVR
jgi:hypothetical protein